MLDNQAIKYYRNIETPDNLLYNYQSREAENKLRIDRNFSWNDYQFSTGTNINFAKYTNDSTVKQVNQNSVDFDVINSELNLVQYGLYLQTAKKFFENKVQVSLGARLDASNYSDLTNNPLEQFSPRFSLNYKFAENYSYLGDMHLMQKDFKKAIGFYQKSTKITDKPKFRNRKKRVF